MSLFTFTVRRFLLAIPILIGLSILIFLLTRAVGEPATVYVAMDFTDEQIQEVREQYHLDEPLPIQYWYWLNGVFRGDLGYSPTSAAPVSYSLGRFFPATLELALFAIILSIVIGIPLGVLAAVTRDTLMDVSIRFIVFIDCITVMATTISVDEDTRDQLKKLGEKGDSYDDIVKQLIDQYVESRYQKLEEDRDEFETLE